MANPSRNHKRAGSGPPSVPLHVGLHWADDTTIDSPVLCANTANPVLESEETKTSEQAPVDDTSTRIEVEAQNAATSTVRRSMAAKREDEKDGMDRVDPEKKDKRPQDQKRHTITITPWTKKLILAIDGGGVLAYSSLILLHGLMRKIAEEECRVDPDSKSSADSPLLRDWSLRKGVYLPCHYFDYIAGTSFGGYLSIMLGRLQLSVEDCIEQFEKLQGTIDKDPRFFEGIPSLLGILHAFDFRNRSWPTKDRMVIYEPLLETYSDRPTMQPETKGSRRLESHPTQCKTIAICLRSHKRHSYTHAFHSYANATTANNSSAKREESQSRKSHDLTVLHVAKAITSPPISFSPFTDDNGSYVDGTYLLKNPTAEVYRQITELQERGSGAIDTVLSFGHSDLKSITNDLRWKVGLIARGRLESKRMSSEEVHAEMEAKSRDSNFKYQRFEVKNLVKQGWTRPPVLKTIKDITEKCIKEKDAELQEYAAHLVKRRRARAKTRPWEAFSLGLQYLCRRCTDEESEFPSRRLLTEHLQSRHGFILSNTQESFDKFETELDQSRVARVDDSSFPPASKRYASAPLP